MPPPPKDGARVARPRFRSSPGLDPYVPTTSTQDFRAVKLPTPTELTSAVVEVNVDKVVAMKLDDLRTDLTDTINFVRKLDADFDERVDLAITVREGKKAVTLISATKAVAKTLLIGVLSVAVYKYVERFVSPPVSAPLRYDKDGNPKP